jgi:hypothetical protein
VTVKELLELLEKHPDKNAEVIAFAKGGSLAFKTEAVLVDGLEFGYVGLVLI